MPEIRRRSPARRRKRSTACRFSVTKRNRTSVLAGDDPVTGICDNDGVGIRTRRMSAAAADSCNNQKSASLVVTENVNVDNRSRLSSASAAATVATNLSTEVAGLCFLSLWSSCKYRLTLRPNDLQCSV